MNIAVIDDEKLALEALIRAIKEAQPDAAVCAFRKPDRLLSFIKDHEVNLAFLDIEMNGINGLELAGKMKLLYPRINIVFVTGYPQYTLDAFSLRASGYLLKPVTPEDIRGEIQNLRNPLPVDPLPGRLRIQTFGNFEAFCGKTSLHFGRSKAKELFAYLIDRRGSSCSMSEIAAVLWEDRPYNRSQLKQIHTYIAEIRNVLREVGASEVLLKKRNSISIDVNAVDCDYYRFLEGDVQTINSFTGEYMTNYSWAEFTVGSLSRLAKKGP